MRRAQVQALALAAAIGLAGCSPPRGERAPERAATLVLNARPGAVHTGIYTTVDRGYDDALGVNLRIRTPSDSDDAAKRLASGDVDFAVLDIDDLAVARERGGDLVGVMAIVQGPAYPRLVLATSRATLDDEPGVVRAAVQAIARGYSEAINDPAGAVSTLVASTSGLERMVVEKELDRVSPSFIAGARTFGELSPARLRAWALRAQRSGIVARPIDVARAFDDRWVPRSGSRE